MYLTCLVSFRQTDVTFPITGFPSSDFALESFIRLHAVVTHESQSTDRYDKNSKLVGCQKSTVSIITERLFPYFSTRVYRFYRRELRGFPTKITTSFFCGITFIKLSVEMFRNQHRLLYFGFK